MSNASDNEISYEQLETVERYVVDEENLSDKDDEFEASIGSTVFTLGNNIVGAGILSLPWCFRQAGIVEGSLLMLLVCLLSGTSMIIIAKCCDLTECFNFREMGEKALGSTFGILLQCTMFVYTFFSCVSFMILVGDFTSGDDGFPQGLCGEHHCDNFVVKFLHARFTAVLACTLLVMLPLASMRSLNSLRFTSVLAICGMFYLLGMLIYEYSVYDGKRAAPGEINIATPSWGTFSAAPIMNVAFIAHYNIPRFYQEMKDRSVKKFSVSVSIAIGMCASCYFLVALFGYLIFGNLTESDILNNFDKSYMPAVIGRIIMASVVMFTYPLVFNSFRASAQTILTLIWPNCNFYRRRNVLRLTFLLVGLTLIPGSTLTNIGIVLDYKGALLGGAIGFGLPAWIFLARTSPEKVTWCCIKPQKIFDVEEPLVQPRAVSRVSPFWTHVAFTFIAWSVVTGVMGFTVTTIKILKHE
mmetsp:Transcript_40773/g.65468  ORF Transcript_40773/g.65468 Transcript_40773/m.65468 type:complete len:470 (+) Transcript_40773:132-1541(+)